MLGFFRRLTKSKLGGIIAIALLAMIAFAFAAGDVTGLGHGLGGMSDKTVAEVGDEKIPETELVQRVKQALQQVQQQQPTADMAGLVGANGVERLLDQLVTARALATFAGDQGMVVSKRAVDGELASIPSFRGPDGKFSDVAYQGVLAQNRVTDAQVRADIARERLIQQLTAPANGGAKVSAQLALPYASLLLERRKGAIGFIPAAALPKGAPPTDAELAAFYRTNAARFTVPERRVMRYAMVSPQSMAAQSQPTDADIAAAYKDQAARFAASEKRSAQAVVVLDQATANAIVAKVKDGASVEAAAREAGLEARTFAALDKATLATQTSQAVADALFAAPANGVAGPIRASGSFTVGKVTAIQQVGAKTLAQARAELLPEVTKAKEQALIAKLNDTMDSAAAEGATFDEIVRDNKLAPLKTAALLQNGVDPANLKTPADPALAPVVQAGFAAEQGDSPQIVPVGQDGGFALVTLDNVLPAAARPLAEVRTELTQAMIASRAFDAARKIADQVAAKATRGAALATALAETGLKLPPVKTVDEPRAKLAATPNPDPAFALMFAMAPGSAKLVPAPQGAGWLVVKLDTIVPGDASRNPETLAAAQRDMNRFIGGELAQQFGLAVRKHVGATINPAGVKRTKDELLGRTADNGN